MFRVRSDLGLSVPYGDPINLQIELDRPFDYAPDPINPELEEIGSRPYEQMYTVQAHIRNRYGHLLGTFKFIYEDGFYYLFCDDVIPVGLHYMDMRIEVLGTKGNNFFHTETIQLDVYGSVTHNYWEDTSGMDSRYI